RLRKKRPAPVKPHPPWPFKPTACERWAWARGALRYNGQESHFQEPPMQDRIAYQGITFDDVLLEPGYSDVLPRDVDVRTWLTRSIRLNLPVISSPMDTVTESDLAIAL